MISRWVGDWEWEVEDGSEIKSKMHIHYVCWGNACSTQDPSAVQRSVHYLRPQIHPKIRIKLGQSLSASDETLRTCILETPPLCLPPSPLKLSAIQELLPLHCINKIAVACLEMWVRSASEACVLCMFSGCSLGNGILFVCFLCFLCMFFLSVLWVIYQCQ